MSAAEDRVAELEGDNERLRVQVSELEGVVVDLKNRIADLEQRLGRSSKNSSLPPSRDSNQQREDAKQNRAARRAAQRRQGKQPGSEGRHLSQVARPERRVPHRPACCARCGADLAGAAVLSAERRQVFDLPLVKVEVTEHVAEKLRCGCGRLNVGAFPPEATAAACWGPGVRALGLYLTQRQHIPLARAAEMLSDVLGATVSTGFLAGLAPEADRRLVPFVARAKQLLATNPVLHTDETSIRVSGQSWWLHVLASPLLTLLVCHRRRGREAIEAIAVLPSYRGVIVHDGFASYDYLDNARHAQCGAHVLRHLGAAMEHDDTKLWARLMTEVLLDAAAAAKRAAGQGRHRVPASTAWRLRQRYHHCLDIAERTLPAGPPPAKGQRGDWPAHQRDAWNLARRLRADEADVLRFLTDNQIPFTNNDAERPLRPAKLHDKVNGTFRNAGHAEAFATIRSYLDTAAKHGKNRLQVLTELFTTGPWLPTDAAPT